MSFRPIRQQAEQGGICYKYSTIDCMQTYSHTLSNGLRVILIDTQAFPTITALLLVSAGSRYETEKNNGISHFLEHMAFKGTKKYPSSFELSSFIEGLGASFNAYTSKDHTGYYIKATNEHFEKLIDVLSEMLLKPLLKEEEIDREKGVIVEEINMYEDSPQRRIGELYDNLLYQQHPLGFDIAGTRETVTSFNKKSFTDYIDTHYHPENAVLVVAGGVANNSKVINIIESKFTYWKNKAKISFNPFISPQTKSAYKVHYKKTEQAHLCLGFRAFSFLDKRKYILSVLAALLGGGMSSRLFIKVRERLGLCYYISTSRELFEDTGSLVTQAGVSNDLDKIKKAIEIIFREHMKIGQGSVTDAEILQVKSYLKGRFLMSLEDSLNVASLYGNKQLLENIKQSPEEIVQEFEKVTKDQVVSLARELFQQKNLNFTLIGPFRQDDFLNFFNNIAI